jgi:hypothetical protein
MKNFITFIKKLISKEIPRPIGRWRIEKCNKKMNYKIDLSNEDHCGPCGQYALEKIELKDTKKGKSKSKVKNIIIINNIFYCLFL